MSYCVNCGVELESAAKKCALCETPVINPNIKEENSEPSFSSEVLEITKNKKKKLFATLASTVIAIPQIVCFLINLFVYKGIWWSLHIIGAGCLAWVIFILPFFLEKMRVYLMWLFDTVAVVIYAFIVYNLTDIGGICELKGVVLIILLNSALVLSYILWVRARKRHWVLKVLYIVCCVAVSSIGVGSILSFLCSVKYAFELGIICFASLIAIVAFLSYCYSSKTIRKWLSKRLFV